MTEPSVHHPQKSFRLALVLCQPAGLPFIFRTWILRWCEIMSCMGDFYLVQNCYIRRLFPFLGLTTLSSRSLFLAVPAKKLLLDKKPDLLSCSWLAKRTLSALSWLREQLRELQTSLISLQMNSTIQLPEDTKKSKFALAENQLKQKSFWGKKCTTVERVGLRFVSTIAILLAFHWWKDGQIPWTKIKLKYTFALNELFSYHFHPAAQVIFLGRPVSLYNESQLSLTLSLNSGKLKMFGLILNCIFQLSAHVSLTEGGNFMFLDQVFQASHLWVVLSKIFPVLNWSSKVSLWTPVLWLRTILFNLNFSWCLSTIRTVNLCVSALLFTLWWKEITCFNASSSICCELKITFQLF